MTPPPDWSTPRASMTRELGQSTRRRLLLRLAGVASIALVAFVSGLLLSVQDPASLPVRIVVGMTSIF